MGLYGRLYGRMFGRFYGDGATAPVVVDPLVFTSEPPLFCYPFHSDSYANVTTTWYGGGYVTRMNVTKLGTEDLSDVARTLDCTLANTEMRCHFGVSRVIQAFVIPSGNYSRAAKYRVTIASSDAALSNGAHTYRSAWIKIWPSWLSIEEAWGRKVPIVHFVNDLVGTVSGLYGRCEIDDQANGDGYLEFPRAAFTGVYVFPRNMSVGASGGRKDNTESWMASSGAQQFNVGGSWREDDFVISRVEGPEMFGFIRTMDARLGSHGQTYFCPGQHHPLLWDLSYLCTTRERTKAEWAWSTETRKSIALHEAVA